MFRPNIRNRTFDRMGDRYAPLVDPNHFLGRSSLHIPRSKKQPRVNLKEGDKIMEMEIAFPGFSKKEIEVSVSNDILTIRAEKEVKEEKSNLEYVLQEFDHDTLERRFKLAEGIAHEKIQATYKNGILKLTFIDVPYSEEKWYKKVIVQ